MTPEQELQCAVLVAQSAYSTLRKVDPNQAMGHFFVVVMDVATPRGRAAAKRLLMNDGQTDEAAEQAVSRHARDADAQGATMMGATLTLPAVIELLDASGAPEATRPGLAASLAGIAKHDVLRVVLIANAFHTFAIVAGLPDPSKLEIVGTARDLDPTKLH